LLGPKQAIQFFFASGTVPSSGTMGVMVRARGTGKLMVSAGVGSPEQLTLPEVANVNDFTDGLASPQVSWTAPPMTPVPLVLQTGPDDATLVEIDCVVPYFVR
jgi:hypothetical protein